MLRTGKPATGDLEERVASTVRCVGPILITACAALAACGVKEANSGARDGATAAGLRGSPIGKSLAKPAFVLTRTDGSAYDFAQQTEGKVALLFFGYTHCPDVCPLHMANIAAVLAKMPWEARDAIRVVFVTTDPARDTPERLGSWLAGFDPSFVGLRGPPDTVSAIQSSLGLLPATRQPSAGPTGEYLVGHAAQVIAFGLDNVARVVYPFGTRQDDWAHDLPLLAQGRSEAGTGGDEHAAHGSLGTPAELAIAPPVIAAAPDGQGGALYITIMNGEATADTLRAVTVVGGGIAASLHSSAAMDQARAVVVPAGGRLVMAPGGVHVMLQARERRLTPGSSLPVEVALARRGKVIVPATIVTYAQLDSVLALARASFQPR